MLLMFWTKSFNSLLDTKNWFQSLKSYSLFKNSKWTIWGQKRCGNLQNKDHSKSGVQIATWQFFQAWDSFWLFFFKWLRVKPVIQGDQ